VRIELTTLGLWDLRATNCAIAAISYINMRHLRTLVYFDTTSAHPIILHFDFVVRPRIRRAFDSHMLLRPQTRSSSRPG
jgi:hypothetical protein